MTYFEKASPDQAPFLVQLALDSNATYHYRTVSDTQARPVFLLTDEHFKEGRVAVLKGKTDEVLGFYALLCKKKKGAEINTLTHCFVKPGHIGKGYGKLLFQEAMRVARDELSWEGLQWESDPQAAWFYTKMGAKCIGHNPCLLNPAYTAPLFIYPL